MKIFKNIILSFFGNILWCGAKLTLSNHIICSISTTFSTKFVIAVPCTEVEISKSLECYRFYKYTNLLNAKGINYIPVVIFLMSPHFHVDICAGRYVTINSSVGSKRKHVEINCKKTKCMILSKGDSSRCEICVRGITFRQVETFYPHKGKCEAEIWRRFRIAKRSFSKTQQSLSL